MTFDVVDQIMSERTPDPVLSNTDRRHETWLLSEGIVPLATMKTLMPSPRRARSV